MDARASPSRAEWAKVFLTAHDTDKADEWEEALPVITIANGDLPDAFDLLGVPERERIVVAIGHEHAVGFDGVEQIVRERGRRVIAATLCVMPVRDEWHEGHEEHRRGEQQPPSV